MPKSKPTQVIVHRIEFQEKERDMLEQYAMSKAINNLMWPVVAAGVGAGAVFIGWQVSEKLYGWYDNFLVPNWVDANHPVWSKENKENFRKAKPSLWQQAISGPSILWAMAKE